MSWFWVIDIKCRIRRMDIGFVFKLDVELKYMIFEIENKFLNL